jgi:2-oxoglutarate ferredoxin oxidoreductase subunit alpha
VQECADLTYLAFDLSDRYRVPVILLADGMIGQMMEGVVLPPERALGDLPHRDWTAGGMKKAGGRPSRHITSLNLIPEELEKRTRSRFERYDRIKTAEIRYEIIPPPGGAKPEMTIAAYGTSARVAQGAQKLAEKAGIALGIFRPITLWPFPYQALAAIGREGKPILTVEMSMGQFVEDVRLAVLGAAPVHLLSHSGGVIPTEEEVFAEIKRLLGK